MRFLLELVACCVSPPAASPGQEISEMSVMPREEETKSLVAVSRRYSRRRRKRGRTGGGGAALSGSAVEWKPSLYAISEDNVVMEKRSETREVSERMVKRKSGPHIRVHDRSHTDDYGRAPLATVIPAFAPTAFLF